VSAATHPWRIRDYRLFWIARFSAVAATMAMVVVLAAQTYLLARREYAMSEAEAAFLIGLLGLAQFLPLLLLTPVAGYVADRFDRRRVAMLANLLDLLVCLVLALANVFDWLSLPLLFVMAALHGAARVFVGPAMSAIVPNIVPAEVLPRAVAFNSIAWQSASVIGPAIGGLLLGRSEELPYLFGIALLMLAAIGVIAIKPFAMPPRNNLHPVRQMIDGARYVWNERFLLGCISLDLFAVLLGGATAMLPVFAYDVLHVGDEGLGIMRAAPAVGAAVVALWLGFRPLARNVGIKMLWAVVVFGAATVAFGLSRFYLLSLAMLVLLGAADMVSVFIRGSLVQLNTPDDKRGRVSSISGLAISASNELGEMQSGLAAAVIGATGAVVAGGAGAIIVTALWAWIFPELRRAKTFAPQYRIKEPVS
jgi:MFS family permease